MEQEANVLKKQSAKKENFIHFKPIEVLATKMQTKQILPVNLSHGLLKLA